MKIKYNRTSTINQDGQRFEHDKDQYDLVLFDKGVSGSVEFKKRPMVSSKLIPLIQEGKVSQLVVEELSRLGRNTVDTLNTLKWLDENNILITIRNFGNFSSRVQNLKTGEWEKNPMWNLITSVMSSLYELEKENIAERTKTGRLVYVSKGGKLGRKIGTVENRTDFLNKDKTQKIASQLKQGKSIRDVAGRLNVSTKTVQKVKKVPGCLGVGWIKIHELFI
jgi:DNA invertase Pin-like site-specific DNA recombinase